MDLNNKTTLNELLFKMNPDETFCIEMGIHEAKITLHRAGNYASQVIPKEWFDSEIPDLTDRLDFLENLK